MIKFTQTLLHLLVGLLLRLRYSITVNGLENIKQGDRPIVFLPNHPALIDPVIVMHTLFSSFRPRPLADEQQLNGRFVSIVAKMTRAVTIPKLGRTGRQGTAQVYQALDVIEQSLHLGENILLYPAGQLTRAKVERLGARSAVHTLVNRVPNARVVLVRTKGLWGSSFSWAGGQPSLTRDVGKYCGALLAAAMLFMPRRKVEVDFYEPADLPREADRMRLNSYLEGYYNQGAVAAQHVPLYWWQGRRPKAMPEPAVKSGPRDTSMIPFATKQIVEAKLMELSGVEQMAETDSLVDDLAMDSLVLVEFSDWLGEEFACGDTPVNALETVADCMLVAGGMVLSDPEVRLQPASSSWFTSSQSGTLQFGAGMSINELFLNQARKRPDKVILSDQFSGEKTYRQLICSLLVLVPEIRRMESSRVGIMLPASVSGALAYLAVLFAGKEPVLVNWTAGAGQMRSCLEKVGVDQVISAGPFLNKLEQQGFSTTSMQVEYFLLDDFAAGLPFHRKIGALIGSRMSWRQLAKARPADNAAILFTSGSESQPKAVPLTHENILANGRDFSSVLSLQGKDSLLGVLPIFHSLGLSGTVIMPLCTGLRTVYWPNPTEGAMLGRMVERYQTSMFITTPTFMQHMLKASESNQLASLRLVFSGAEQCPPQLFEQMESIIPQATFCEGYGVTECSPVITVNSPDNPCQGAIGRLLPSMEALLVHPESGDPVTSGQSGRLLVRGPNVFHGYLEGGNGSFVHHKSGLWYDTGDVVTRDKQGVFHFKGRLKRFVKLGGEMISLPAIEHVLNRELAEDGEPSLAVVASSDTAHSQLCLVTTLDVERHQVNQEIRRGGLSPLHNIRRVIRVKSIPLLGTGKTDYRSLEQLTAAACAELAN